jgi:hypothetical protein
LTTTPETGPVVREEVLQARDSMGRLNAPVSVVKPSTWLQFAAGLILVAGGMSWLIWGSAPETVSGPGVLLSENGLRPVVSTVEGVVSSVDISVEEEAAPDQNIATVTMLDGTAAVIGTGDSGGRVVQLDVTVGGWVEPGMTVARLLTADSPSEIFAVLRPGDAVRVTPGMSATVSPAGIPAAQYGSITSTVTEVRTLPLSPELLASITAQNQALAQELTSVDSGVLVILQLDTAQTPSGYAWTDGTGPNVRIPPASPLTVTITIAKRDPLGMLFSG